MSERMFFLSEYGQVAQAHMLRDFLPLVTIQRLAYQVIDMLFQVLKLHRHQTQKFLTGPLHGNLPLHSHWGGVSTIAFFNSSIYD